MAVFGPGWRDQVHRVTNNHACIGVFTKPGGGTIFNAGVTDWACALEHADPTVERITHNVLSRLSSDPFDRLDAPGLDGVEEGRVVELVLVGVPVGELHDGPIEDVALAQVGGDGDRVAGPRVGAG